MPPEASQTTVLTLRLPTLLMTKLRDRAKAEGMSAEIYAGLIFCAAYSVRVRPSGDIELEAALERAFRPAAPGPVASSGTAAPAFDAQRDAIERRHQEELGALRDQLAERTQERNDQARKATDLFEETARAQRSERALIVQRDELQERANALQTKLAEVSDEAAHYQRQLLRCSEDNSTLSRLRDEFETRAVALQGTVESQAEEIAALLSRDPMAALLAAHPRQLVEPGPEIEFIPAAPRAHQDPAPTVPASTRRTIRFLRDSLKMGPAEISRSTGVPEEAVKALLTPASKRSA